MRTSPRLLILCWTLGLGLGLAPSLLANETSREVEEILARGPRTPNPALSFLPVGVVEDWQYWNARMGLDARTRRQQALLGGASRGPEITENEAPGTIAENDLPNLGQEVVGVGTTPGDQGSVRIRGTLLAPPTDRSPAVEPDSSIPQARDLKLVTSEVVVVPGVIGDGNAPRADFDFFRCTVTAGQHLQVAVRTPDPTADLDPIVGLFDSSGLLVTANDNRPVNGVLLDRDSLLEVTLNVPGTYFIVVGGFNPIGGGDLPPQFPSNPFDPSTAPPPGSQGEYRLLVGLDSPPSADRDFYRFHLRAGDVIGATVEGGGARISISPVREDGVEAPLIASRNSNLSSIAPAASPLPVGGRAAGAVVVSADGEYAVGVEAAPDFDIGAYLLDVTVARSPLGASSSPRRQVLFLDLDGATVDPSLFGFPAGNALLSPFASFLAGWGLGPGDENAAIDAILAVVQENLEDDLRARGLEETFDVDILNSRDHGDPFGEADVSRIILGGTIQELGIGTIGIAESVDVGNFSTGETGIVLLDLLSAAAPDPNSLNSLERAAEASMVQLIGAAVGTIAAHEAGHLFANFHTDRGPGPANVMDRGGDLVRFLGLGDDRVFGTSDDVDPDFGKDNYEPTEGFVGVEDTLNSISFDLGSGGSRPTLTVVPSLVPGELSFGAVAVGATARRDLRLGNAGTASLTVTEISLREIDGTGFALETPFAPFTLAPGEARALPVLFSPAGLGPATALLKIQTDILRQEGSFLLSGQGGVPAAVASPLAHDFGVVEYSEADPTRRFSFEVRNEAGEGDLLLLPPLMVGQAPQQYDALEAFPVGTSPASGATGAGSLVIPPGGSVQLPVSFRPTGLIGDLGATVVLRTNDPSAQRILLQLAGRANGPDVDVLPVFGLFFSPLRPGTLQSRTATIANRGNRDLEIASLTLTGPDAGEFVFTPPPLPFLLPPRAERVFSIQSAPSSLGEKTAFLEIASNDPDEALSILTLGGVGAEPDLVVEDGAGNFGSIRPGTSRDQTLEIANDGGFRLRVSTTEISGPQSDDFRILSGGAPFTVSPGISWSLRLRFQTAELGLRQATLTIASDDPEHPLLEVPLTGSGALPGLSLSKECQAELADRVVICRLEVLALGPGPAPGVVVEDALPLGLSYLEDSCGAGAPPAGAPWTWQPGSLAEGALVACDLTLAIDPQAPIATVNTATATTTLHGAGNPASTANAMIDLQLPADIPALSLLGLAVLILLLLLGGILILRRQSRPFVPEREPR